MGGKYSPSMCLKIERTETYEQPDNQLKGFPIGIEVMELTDTNFTLEVRQFFKEMQLESPNSRIKEKIALQIKNIQQTLWKDNIVSSEEQIRFLEDQV